MVEEDVAIMVAGQRSWWRPLLADGTRGFVVIAEGEDVTARQAEVEAVSWEQVTPVEYYEALVAVEAARPVLDDDYLESLEETLDLWKLIAEREAKDD
jgi:hypothetical protein